ncbi:MAG: TolC family protein [Thermodesulfobacteriota bacterium]|nr:TolC family protein [Thermodesulfobacteriota bacterium]
MNKYIIAILIAIVAISTFPTPTLAAPLTLDQCIKRGMTHNPEVTAYHLAIDEANEGINEAWGAFLPTLSASYNYNQLSNGNSGERDTDYLDQDSNSFSCRLTQPIFTGLSGVAGLKRARKSEQYRRAELRYVQQQLTQKIRSSFYALLHAEQRTLQWQASVQRLEQQQQIATAWVEQQLAPRLHKLEIEVELSNARHELIRSTSEQAIAAAQLREWLSLEPQSDVQLSGTLYDKVAAPCISLEDCLDLALKRPELKMSQINVEIARQDAKMILARNLPQAQVDASWTDYQREYDNSNYPEDDRDYYSVSFNISIKPFQGGRNLFAWRKQRIAVDRQQQLQARQRHAIISEVQTRYQQLNESRARIKNAVDTLTAATEAYQLATKSAELGVVSLNDLLDAELRLTRAEINKINAQYALCSARVQLQYAIGFVSDYSNDYILYNA